METAIPSCSLKPSGPPDAVAPPKRRSTRLTISIPVVVRGKDEQGVPFVEQGQTLVVSLHGAMLTLPRRLSLDCSVTVENPVLQKSAEAVVLWCKQKVGQASCFEAAVELKQPQDLWGISFPSREKESPADAIRPRDTNSVNLESPSSVPSAPKPETASPIEIHRSPGERVGAPVEGSPMPSPAADSGRVAQQVPGSGAIDSHCVEEEKERFRAGLKELSATSAENVRLLTEAHLRLYNQSLARRALDARNTCAKEFEQSLAEVERAAVERLRKQMEQELETFLERASAQADRLAEDAFRAIESRISSIQFRVVSTNVANDQAA